MKGKLIEFITKFSIFIAGSTIILLVLYIIDNNSGHTSVSPYLALFVFCPVLMMGIFHKICSKRLKLSNKIGLTAIIMSIIGIVFLIIIDQANILLEYHVWLTRDMP